MTLMSIGFIGYWDGGKYERVHLVAAWVSRVTQVGRTGFRAYGVF
jgi:hypothetical protein